MRRSAHSCWHRRLALVLGHTHDLPAHGGARDPPRDGRTEQGLRRREEVHHSHQGQGDLPVVPGCSLDGAHVERRRECDRGRSSVRQTMSTAAPTTSVHAASTYSSARATQRGRLDSGRYLRSSHVVRADTSVAEALDLAEVSRLADTTRAWTWSTLGRETHRFHRLPTCDQTSPASSEPGRSPPGSLSGVRHYETRLARIEAAGAGRPDPTWRRGSEPIADLGPASSPPRRVPSDPNHYRSCRRVGKWFGSEVV